MLEMVKEYPNWNDWCWQYDNSYHTVGEIKRFIKADNLEQSFIKDLDSRYISLTPYMLYTILNTEKEHRNALQKQFMPLVNNTGFTFTEKDSLKEEEACVVPNLIRKHLNRVALLVNNYCACYCQFCTRQRIMCNPTAVKYDLSDAIKYIRTHPEIQDVLITGGDPFLEETKAIEQLLQKLHDINHVKIVRFSTRLPITLPMRFDYELINILCKYSPIYVNIHINHLAEITEQSKTAILNLANAGIPLGSQTVLLRGINNNVNTLQELFEQLVRIKVKPYYLYQCDRVQGCEDYITSIDEGIKTINELHYRMSGFAVPRYVIDTPKMGKLIAGPTNIESINKKTIHFSNHNNEIYKYEVIEHE